jgi:hypothetical protein
VDVEAWPAEQYKLPANWPAADWRPLLRRLYAEHGPLGPAELAIAVDLERMRLMTVAVELVTADVRATISEPMRFDVHHQDEGSIGVLYCGNTDHSVTWSRRLVGSARSECEGHPRPGRQRVRRMSTLTEPELSVRFWSLRENVIASEPHGVNVAT